MNTKFDFVNLTESNQLLNITTENLNPNLTMIDSYIPIQTEAFLGVKIYYLNI